MARGYVDLWYVGYVRFGRFENPKSRRKYRSSAMVRNKGSVSSSSKEMLEFENVVASRSLHPSPKSLRETLEIDGIIPLPLLVAAAFHFIL